MKVFGWLLGTSFVFLNGYGISYVPGTEDIPLMEGASLVEEKPSIFDVSQGRVSVSRIVCSWKGSEVENFYRQTLPNLGWIRLSKNKYQREEQFLDIKTDLLKEKTLIIFELKESH